MIMKSTRDNPVLVTGAAGAIGRNLTTMLLAKGHKVVARAVAAILDDPAPHIGHIYNLTGPESADLNHYARVFSEALGRTIRYRDVPTSEWSEKLRAAGQSEHVTRHLTVMTELHKQGCYDRMSEDYLKLAGETPASLADFVKHNAREFTRR
jgi:uncharacterized protein YbjT (DUF2867 family)